MNLLSQLETNNPEQEITSRKKVSKNIVEFNNTINGLDITDTYRLLHPKQWNTHSSSSSYGTFSKKRHICKTHLNKF